MKPKNDITAKELRKLLHYDPATGIFRWKVTRRGRYARPGVIAGNENDGYWYVGINGRRYLASRIAWLYMKGRWPKSLIDHKNNNSLDNKFKNLRPASNAQNLCNSRPRSALKGTSAHRNSWVAQISTGGKRIYLGCFKTQIEAHTAYAAAAKKIHGKFARLS